VDFRKTYYILPNLFTLSSVFCGFISISLSASSGTTGSDLYQAALAICFGFFFDTADGRVARLTKTQTDLGRDLDSLADAITFGVAPAMMVYKFGLTSFGRLGIFFAGLFVCAGVMRLARFNVLSRREAAAGHHAPGKYTLGLTIPAAASVLVLMVVVAHNVHPYRIASDGAVAAVVLVLSYLMVSNVRYRTFKSTQLNRGRAALLLLLVGLSVVSAVQFGSATVLVAAMGGYILFGLGESILLFRRSRLERRRARLAVTSTGATESVPEDGDEDEEDFV
jgi:CDP-diacylglycerol--serine O-phosphatidyltransferase